MSEHGFDDDVETRALLRSAPPAHALSWVEAALGGRVDGIRPLLGGMSSAVHQLTMISGGGTVRHVVLRRYVRPELNAEEPDVAEREGRSLRLVEPLPLATPQLLALDPTGEGAGVPTVLMSWLPGAVVWWPEDVHRWVAGLAALLPTIHAAAVPPGFIRPFASYEQLSYAPPAWASRPEAWERAVEIFQGPVPPDDDAFLHRDFHPGNVLWESHEVSGVVDWASASVGPVSADVGHCRGNLARSHGIEAADEFTAEWEEISGKRYHPWGDISAIIGFLDGIRESPPAHPAGLDVAIQRAVADIGGGT